MKKNEKIVEYWLGVAIKSILDIVNNVTLSGMKCVEAGWEQHHLVLCRLQVVVLQRTHILVMCLEHAPRLLAHFALPLGTRCCIVTPCQMLDARVQLTCMYVVFSSCACHLVHKRAQFRSKG